MRLQLLFTFCFRSSRLEYCQNKKKKIGVSSDNAVNFLSYIPPMSADFIFLATSPANLIVIIQK